MKGERGISGDQEGGGVEMGAACGRQGRAAGGELPGALGACGGGGGGGGVTVRPAGGEDAGR